MGARRYAALTRRRDATETRNAAKHHFSLAVAWWTVCCIRSNHWPVA
jgi:hypothetical protein